MKPVHAFIFVLVVSSCRENVQEKEPVMQLEVQPIQFHGVIPDHIPDSAKAAKILAIVHEIETDTTLTVKSYPDTLGRKTSAYFRDGSLLKIKTGVFSETQNITDYNYTTYYFFMGTFISMRYECNKYQQTGRCNPVRSSSLFCFYRDTVLFQKHHSTIGDYYWGCGCSDLSLYEASDRMVDFESTVAKEVKRLLGVIDHP